MNAEERIHRYGRFGHLGLERMETLMEKLGNPQDDLEYIHVAGTNGKGSVCKYIYEMLRAGGYHVGLFTSPYLEVFNERIELDGEYISDDDLEAVTDQVIAKADEMEAEGLETPTEFEIITAIAFVYFAQKGCDFVVLEVGLGGRGDSTNIIKAPLCSVIASISLDHTDRLGTTIPEIAAEKAGIIKKGCPVVINTDNDDARAVFRKKAHDMDAPLFDAARVPVKITRETLEAVTFNVEILDHLYRSMEISMLGRHQVSTAAEALFVITLLVQQGKLELENRDIKDGLRRAKQIGRFEILGRDPFVIIDGAHNPDASLRLRETVQKYFADGKILMVCGILADKDVEDVLVNFRGITDQFIAAEPPNPRRMPAGELAERIAAEGGECHVCADPKEAVRCALEQRNDYDLILFAGSLYLIGSIRKDIINAL